LRDQENTVVDTDYDATVATVITPSQPLQGSSGTPSVETTGAGSLRSVATVASPHDAMRLQEVDRIRAFVMFTSFMCLLVAIMVPLLGRDAVATWLLSGASAATVIAAWILLRLTRDESKYQDWMATGFSLVAATAVIAAYYFFGANSAVMMIVPLGAYLLSLGENIKSALVTHIYVSVGHAVVSVLLIVGLIPDVGLVRVVSENHLEPIAMLVMIQAILVATFVLARGVRKATLATLEQLNEAVTDNARRGALLHEAKQELALARKVGGAGRFSDHTFGAFRLGVVMGRGAMGEVYEGVHGSTGALAAVKLLSFDALREPSLVARFHREMEIAQSLQHPNVVGVLAISGQQDEIPFLAMERLVGHSLSEKLRDEASMSLADVSAMISQIAAGAWAAHKEGIIHRDLKPSNVFLHHEGGHKTWKILDFGVSKYMDQGDTLTAGAIVGTPAYMAPEQAQGQAIDARTDVYSLGVIAYRALTGRPAFAGSDLAMVLSAVVCDMPPKPSGSAEVPRDIDFVLAVAMAKEPSDRFATATEFAAALQEVAESRLSSELRKRGLRQILAHPWGIVDLVTT